MELNKIYNMDCLEGMKQLDDNSINCVVTSPPYWGLRDYGVEGQIGLEEDPNEYIGSLVKIFREIKRILTNDGSVWLNLGDSYCGSNSNGAAVVNPDSISYKAGQRLGMAQKGSVRSKINGLKPKDLVGIPWRVALALQADGWWLRSDIIWAKNNCMPESVTDRPTRSHEYIFLLTKNKSYYYDFKAIAEPVLLDSIKRSRRGSTGGKRKETEYLPDGVHLPTMHYPRERRRYDGVEEEASQSKRNKRSVWHISVNSYPEAHFAVYPENLVEPCIKAGCPENGVVLDPFLGSGTTALVALKNNRKFVGFELNPEYVDIAMKRIKPWLHQERLMAYVD